MARKLTPKQEAFCKEYIIDLNATQAAVRAGYSKKTANRIASQLLSKVDIQENIQELMDARSQRAEITADRVLEELAHIAFDDISNYLDFKTVDSAELDKEGNPIPRVVTTIKDSSIVDTRSISEVSQTKDGFRFKMYCKDNALVQLGRHLKLFTDRVDNTSSDGSMSNKVDISIDVIKQIGAQLDEEY